jgi:hypothetical protein
VCDVDNVKETSLTAIVPKNGQEIPIGLQKGLFHQTSLACVVNVISSVLVQILLLVCHVFLLVQPAVVDQR